MINTRVREPRGGRESSGVGGLFDSNFMTGLVTGGLLGLMVGNSSMFQQQPMGYPGYGQFGQPMMQPGMQPGYGRQRFRRRAPRMINPNAPAVLPFPGGGAGGSVYGGNYNLGSPQLPVYTGPGSSYLGAPAGGGSGGPSVIPIR